MKKRFICSLIHNGIVGGIIYVDNKFITYKTNKMTIDRKYKNISLPIDGICLFKWNLFLVSTFYMNNGEQYKFIIFNKWRFNKYYSKVKDIL